MIVVSCSIVTLYHGNMLRMHEEKKDCNFSRSYQMPYTDPITEIAPYVRTYSWATIQYEYLVLYSAQCAVRPWFTNRIQMNLLLFIPSYLKEERKITLFYIELHIQKDFLISIYITHIFFVLPFSPIFPSYKKSTFYGNYNYNTKRQNKELA